MPTKLSTPQESENGGEKAALNFKEVKGSFIILLTNEDLMLFVVLTHSSGKYTHQVDTLNR